MNVYTRIDGKLAMYQPDTDDVAYALSEVTVEVEHLGRHGHEISTTILAVIDGGKVPCIPSPTTK